MLAINLANLLSRVQLMLCHWLAPQNAPATQECHGPLLSHHFGRFCRLHFPWPLAWRLLMSPGTGKGISLQGSGCGWALWPGVLLASPCPGVFLFLPSSLTWVWATKSQNGPCNFFLWPTCGGHPHMQGWIGGSCTPRVVVQGFCYLSFAGDSLLSSLGDAPPCLDMICLNKSSQKLSAHDCYPWGYPLQVPGAEDRDAENP